MDWGRFVIENRRRPLVGWSQFQANCSKIKIARSFIQAFVFDMQNQMSHQTQLLEIHMEFAAGQVLPTNMQIAVLMSIIF